MKKKTLALALSLVLTLSMTACGSDSSSSEKTSGGRGSAEQTVSESEENEEVEEEIEEEVEEIEEETEEEETAKITFEPFTIEADCCSMTFKEITMDKIMGYTIKVTLENNSDDVTYMFAVEDGYADGLACDPFFASEVAPGKKSNEEIYLNETTLERLGSDPSEIEMYFRIYDSNDWTENPIYEDVVTIYPFGEDNISTYEREAASSDQVLVENDDVSVTIVEVEEDSIWGYTLVLYLENNTDKEVMYAVEDVSVNGYMVDPFWASSLKSGKTKYSELFWSNESLEENDIEEIEEVTMTLRVYDYEDWTGDDIINETITFTP